MTIRITTRGAARWLAHPLGRVGLALALVGFVVVGAAFVYFYNVYAEVIDERLAAPIFQQTSVVFAAPKVVTVGESIAPTTLAEWLRRAGYSQGQPSPVGRFTMTSTSPDALVGITPGPEAYRSPQAVQIQFQGGVITSIASGTASPPSTDEGVDGAPAAAITSYALEPELVTTLFNQKREKRRLLHYAELPPMLVEAVLAIEDRDFFRHGAVNWWRVPAAVYRDVRSGRREQGASTITMQMARNIFGLGFERKGWAGIKRKLAETIVATELEQRLTKPQIFELYANQLYLGQRGSYSIHGFGEAADAYFGKSVGQLNLQECALLAGIIHAPNLDSPYRHAARARRRRNAVLEAMQRAGSITPAVATAAAATPLALTAANNEASDAPYFLDMVRDRISDQIPEHELMSANYRIYTTLDPDLQAAAAAAVSEGMKGVDAELTALRKRQRHRPKTPGANAPAQVALVALDPHTGKVLALVGGRNYAYSQLNHALAQRPTGSIFKPFVYATALETGLFGTTNPITQTSTVLDAPTDFPCPGCPNGVYSPANFENKYFGQVSLRVALEHSLNNATIALAEDVGLDAVTNLAHAAGITSARPTPSEAIGTYTASALQMAGAYTVFANAGMRLDPRLVDGVRSNDGQMIFEPPSTAQAVLDPRVAFLTTNLMESVLNAGTAIRARGMGYDAPAAAKTGTSRDAWFAGYTNNLLCVVWVGLDDYEDLNIEGAHAALPIWTAFMMAAQKLPSYANVEPFAPPPGVEAVRIDTVSGQVATPLCPPAQVEVDYYLTGTAPKQSCHLHASPLIPRGIASVGTGLFHLVHPAPPPPVVAAPAAAPPRPKVAAPVVAKPVVTPKPKAKEQKRGFFGRLFHALGGGDDDKGGGGTKGDKGGGGGGIPH